jgi:hypothetical protein
MISFLGNKTGSMLLWSAVIVCAFFLQHCSGESEQLVRKKLDAICADDLAAIIDSISAKDLLNKPYYEIVFYKSYAEGSYSRKAVVDFYFLKKVSVKVVRKFRYHRSIRMWDRYSNEYVFLHDTTVSTPKK